MSEAESYFRESDVVISDVNLPDSEGFDTITSIVKQLPRTTPLLILSSRKDEEFAAKAVAHGAQDYLVKEGLQRQDLYQRIQFSIIRKRFEIQLERDRDDAKKDADFKSDFLAKMSHEIRTPLNSVVGISDYVDGEFQKLTREQIQESLHQINRSSSYLLNLVNDILDMSKLDAGKEDLKLYSTRIRDLCHNCIEIIKPPAVAKGLSVVCEVDEKVPPWILVDQVRLQQVLINLLGNSGKFTDSGEIRLEVCLPEGSLSRLRFRVKDTGIGISESELLDVMQPYRQLEQSDRPVQKGTGLGLPLSKKLVEFMAGHLSIKSAPGFGTEVNFDLPLITSHECFADGVKDRLLNYLLDSELRILVAEDSEKNQNLIRLFSQNIGFQVDFANDGSEALAAVSLEDYDLIFMDLAMPVLDGYSAASRIQEHYADRGEVCPPIVALTATATEKELQRALNSGCSGYLTKPFKKDQLLAAIVKWTQGVESDIPGGKTSKQRTVMFVDDEVDILEIIQEAGVFEDCNVVLANSPYEALEILRKIPVDIVVSDYKMPRMTGYELFEKAQQESLIDRDSFMFISAHRDEIPGNEVECLPKPFDFEDIKDRIDTRWKDLDKIKVK